MNHSIVFIASMLCLLTVAFGQPAFQSAATTACSAANRGTVNCPTYIAPTSTAVPRASIDGSLSVLAATVTPLFNGTTPPNGFMVQVNGYSCWVNDNGAASIPVSSTTGSGFNLPGNLFVTPPGYRPMGPVSIICNEATYIAARSW
jgi:hypothetical protein